MRPIRHISLCFLGVVLQVLAVEAKGGKGKKKSESESDSNGTSIGGVAGGVIGGLVVLAAMILKYRSQLMKFLRRRTSQDNQPSVSEVSKPPDLEGNATGGYLPHDVPAYPISPPPTQYSPMDWKRDPNPVPPQFHPGPPSFPPTPHMGAAYTPSQYSPASPFPMPHSPPIQYSPTPAYHG